MKRTFSVRQESAVRAASMVNPESGLVGREIFTDKEIYDIELERIFGRCWLYLAHESQIPNPNDFVNVYMGVEPVLVCRNRRGGVSAFINSCRHRGAPVTRADSGNARAFVCPYHGWTYDTTGALVHMPGEEAYYQCSVNKSEWGLAPVAQVASYNGLIFGTFDPEAPSLEEYLGDMRWGLDLMTMQGDLVAAPGITRWVIDANWKFAADNAIGDMYHGAYAHKSAIMVAHSAGSGTQKSSATTGQEAVTDDGITVVTEYGHGFTANFVKPNSIDWENPLAAWRKDADIMKKMGPVRHAVNRANMNVFPNLFVHSGARELSIRNPLSPTKIEVWKTTLIDKNADPKAQREQIRASNRHFGPGGMFEQDDGENWDMSTAGAKGPITRRFDLNYSMGLSRGEVTPGDPNAPAHVKSLFNEHAQLWMYRCWSEFMRAPTWNDLRANHSKPEGIL